MKKPKYLYHGSPKKLIGKKLVPKKPTDIEKRRENIRKGVYTTDIKRVAIAMAIISSKGVKHSSLSISTTKTPGIIYKGWPKQKYIYLYILNSKNFKRTSKDSHQWISSKAIKPIKIEKLLIKDYLNLIRKKRNEK